MPKNERNQNGRSNVRVLHFPAASPMPAANNTDADALADSSARPGRKNPRPQKALPLIRDCCAW